MSISNIWFEYGHDRSRKITKLLISSLYHKFVIFFLYQFQRNENLRKPCILLIIKIRRNFVRKACFSNSPKQKSSTPARTSKRACVFMFISMKEGQILFLRVVRGCIGIGYAYCRRRRARRGARAAAQARARRRTAARRSRTRRTRSWTRRARRTRHTRDRHSSRQKTF